MSNISDKDLDKLFEEAAEGYETPFDESAWAELSERLDDDNDFAYYKFLGGIVGLFILGAFLIWWASSGEDQLGNKPMAHSVAEGNAIHQQEPADGGWIASDKTETPLLSQKNAPIKEMSAAQGKKPEVITGKDLRDKEKVKDGQNGGNSPDREKEEQKEPADVLYQKSGREKVAIDESMSIEGDQEEKEGQGENERKKKGRKDEEGNEGKEDKDGNNGQEGKENKKDHQEKEWKEEGDDKQVYEGQGEYVDRRGGEHSGVQEEEERGVDITKFDGRIADNEEHDDHAPAHSYTEKDDQVAHAGVYSPPLLMGFGYPEYKYPLGEGTIVGVPMPEEAGQKEDWRISRGRWGVKVVYSPDFSSVGYFKPDRLGSNWGIMGEYVLGDRWTLSSGLIYSRKIYFTEEGGGYSYSGSSDISRVDGDCRVIDIPLNVSYYLNRSEYHGVFVSGGFSSYLMLTENYNYFTKSKGVSNTWSESLENENNHFFSILNLSIGYERKIKGNFFLQVEPFLKAPVAGIGEGKINLVSTGAFFSLKYQIIK